MLKVLKEYEYINAPENNMKLWIVEKDNPNMFLGYIDSLSKEVALHLNIALQKKGFKCVHSKPESCYYTRGIPARYLLGDKTYIEWSDSKITDALQSVKEALKLKATTVKTNPLEQVKTKQFFESKKLVESENDYYVAYHLSPSSFRGFDLTHIGGGIGTQLKGWGLYFTLDKKVIEYYASHLEEMGWKEAYLYTVKIPKISDSGSIIADCYAPEGWELYGSLVEEFGGDEKRASLEMAEVHGVNGIEYWDEEDGNSIVLFNPSIVDILKTKYIEPGYTSKMFEGKRS